jgi:hypothetical protein
MRCAVAAMILRSSATDGCAEHFGQGTEARQKRLGDRLGVGARDQAEKQKFQKFIVGKAVRACIGEAVAQAVAMAVVMRLFRGKLCKLRCWPHRQFREEPALVLFSPRSHQPPRFVAGEKTGDPKFRPAGRGGRAFWATR